MSEFELVAVRHGRTAWNQNGRFQGHTDVPLDAAGRAQARGLAAHLASERFDVAVASDLARARETAEIITAGRGIAVRTDARWRELAFGAWEGLTWAEIAQRFPEVDAPPNAGSGFRHAADGETFDALVERVSAAVTDLRATVPAGGRALVTTHAGPLHALLHLALDEAAAQALKIRFVPASVSRFAFGADGGRILTLNQSLAERGA